MRIIALVDNDDLGLVQENEVIGANEKTMQVLVDLKMAKVYDDTKPIAGKGVTIYEEKVYPEKRQIFYNDSIYISKTGFNTSSTFILSEWDILVTGLNQQ